MISVFLGREVGSPSSSVVRRLKEGTIKGQAASVSMMGIHD